MSWMTRDNETTREILASARNAGYDYLDSDDYTLGKEVTPLLVLGLLDAAGVDTEHEHSVISAWIEGFEAHHDDNGTIGRCYAVKNLP